MTSVDLPCQWQLQVQAGGSAAGGLLTKNSQQPTRYKRRVQPNRLSAPSHLNTLTQDGMGRLLSLPSKLCKQGSYIYMYIYIIDLVVEEVLETTVPYPAIQILPNHARSCEWDQLLVFHVVDAVTPPRSQPPLKRAPYEPSGG